MSAKLILRDKEYEIRPGMTLLAALQKNNIVPESVIAMRNGEMITDDEVLRAGDVVKLIAVISGGAGIEILELETIHESQKTNPNSQRR